MKVLITFVCFILTATVMAQLNDATIRTDNTAIGKGQMNYKLKYDQNGLLLSLTTKIPEDLGGMNIVDNYSNVFW